MARSGESDAAATPSGPAAGSRLGERRLQRLIEVGRSLVAELDTEAVLDRVLAVAQELTGARYVALGVLDADRRELERFLTRGVDEPARRAIGQLPRGGGILGLLIEDPRPLRLRDIGEHPRSYGFPAGHPEMRGFLGVPVLIRGEAWGNLYLTEKEGGDFDEADEQAVVVLAQWAAIAIENARLYQSVDRRRAELERAVASLEATTAIARAVGGETRLERVLELIVKRARALVEARTVLILLEDGEDLAVAATAGDVPADLIGRRIPIAGTVSGGVLRSERPERVLDFGARLKTSMSAFGFEARSALFVPLIFRGRGHGVLAAYDRIGDGPEFRDEDERLLLSFAASAATAVATARSVEQERLRHSIEASEQERRRWARELHDETLQVLGGLQVLLSSALRRDDLESFRSATATAVEQIRAEIEGLRNLITELRPAALDALGLEPAIDALADRAQTTEGLVVERRIELGGRLAPELESTVYRLAQEALTNVAKHAGGAGARVTIDARSENLVVEVADDGPGGADGAGSGLSGLRRRVEALDGTLRVEEPAGGGTTVRAELPSAP